MSLNTFLRRLILIGVFAVPFIPFIVSSSMFFPFITGKNFAFRIIVGIIFAAWAILAFKDASYRPKKSPVLMAFAFFIGVITLANVFGENPYRSFWSNYERMEGLIAHLHLFAYFLVATSVLTAEKRPGLSNHQIGGEHLFGRSKVGEHGQRIGMSSIAGEGPRHPPAGVGELHES